MLSSTQLTANLTANPACQDDIDREWHYAFHLADQQYVTDLARDFADFREHYASENAHDMNAWETLGDTMARWRTAVDKGERASL